MAIAIPCYAMFIIGIFCIYITDGTKRLLLNDPNQINSHLQQMEARVQSFENTISVLTNKIQSLEKTNSGLTNRVQSSENTISVLTNMVQSLEKSNSVLTSKHPDGAVFTRWGRKECPDNDTEMIYSGFMGGGSYTESGAAVNYLCLPPDPQPYVLTASVDHTRKATLMGVEYESPQAAIYGQTPGNDVPCAICRSRSAKSSLMVPARNTCYTGWRKQYQGILSAGYFDHASGTELICVDDKPESLRGGEHQDYGKMLYAVQTTCGSLQCPPYHSDQYVSCVVCTK